MWPPGGAKGLLTWSDGGGEMAMNLSSCWKELTVQSGYNKG